MYKERRSGPLLSAVRSFFLHFFVHLHHTLFYGPVLRQPDKEVDNKEYSEIQAASENTVSDPEHQVGDGEAVLPVHRAGDAGGISPEQSPQIPFLPMHRYG